MAAKKAAAKKKPDPATEAKKQATAEQFAEADAKAQPSGMTAEELEAHQAGLSVRGY
jgi:hypothetical protein